MSLRRQKKIAMERARNAMTAVGNLSRKAAVKAHGLRRPLVRWQARRRRFQERVDALRAEAGIEQEIEQVADAGDPIIVGPWLSEVGYEALYWVPFVRWFRATYRIPRNRMLILSRGGAASWYSDITPNHADVFHQVTVEEFAARNAERAAGPAGTIKQLDLSPFERQLIERARVDWGMPRVQVLHPSLLYRLFKQFWAGNRPLSFLDDHAMYSRVAAPPPVAGEFDLPPEYVAVKLYTAQSLQDTPATRAMLRDLLGAVAEQYPLVMLDTGLALDDHDDYGLGAARAIDARRWMTPADNLAVQTRIIAGAKAFVGTCGSIAWLAPMLGVNTTALMTDDKALAVHLQVARRVNRVLGAGRFSPLDLGAFDALGLTVAGRAIAGRA